MITPPHSAAQKPSIVRPYSVKPLSHAVSMSISALTTSRNSPRVRITSGSDSSFTSGFTSALTTVKMAARTTSVMTARVVSEVPAGSVKSIPSTSSTASHRPTALMINRSIREIMVPLWHTEPGLVTGKSDESEVGPPPQGPLSDGR